MSPFFHKQQVEGMWRNSKKDRQGDICLYFHQRTCNLMWSGKAEIGAEMSRFREQVRKGYMCSKTYNNFDRKDCDGKIWYSLTIQATPKLKDTNGEPAQLGMSPINLMIFRYMVDGWTYYFKQRANRDSIFRYLNDLPDDTYVRAKGDTDTYTNGDIPEEVVDSEESNI